MEGIRSTVTDRASLAGRPSQRLISKSSSTPNFVTGLMRLCDFLAEPAEEPRDAEDGCSFFRQGPDTVPVGAGRGGAEPGNAAEKDVARSIAGHDRKAVFEAGTRLTPSCGDRRPAPRHRRRATRGVRWRPRLCGRAARRCVAARSCRRPIPDRSHGSRLSQPRTDWSLR